MGQTFSLLAMPKPLLLLMLVVSLTTAVVALACQEVTAQETQAQEKAKVTQIQIQGNEHVNAGDIRVALPFQVGDEITLADDLKRAEQALMEMGYFEKATVDYRRAEGGIVVMLDLVENPVLDKIEITGNRDWNQYRLLTIPVVGLSFPWPFVDYLVTTDRMKNLLGEHDVLPGHVLNMKKLKEGLGIDEKGSCAANPLPNSICGEYKSQGYFLFAFGGVEPGATLKITVLEGVIESFALPEELEDSLKGEALRILSDLPLLRPMKLQKMQEAVQKISQSIYFEPLRTEDVTFEAGNQPDQVRLRLHLKGRQILENPEHIERIRFVGNTAFPEAELLPRVDLPRGEMVNNYQLLSALQGVYRFYLKEGFILTKFAKEEWANGLLTVRVDEGRIGEIEIRQNSYPTARFTRDQLEELPLENAPAKTPTKEEEPSSQPPGRRNVLMELITHLSNFLGNVLGTSTGSSGLPRTKPEIIAKTLTLKPGQFVNQYRLADSYRKLLSLGYFKDVGFDFQPMEGSSELRMIVDVAEQEKLGSLNGGFSISPEGLVGQLSLSGKNLYGTGQDLSLQFDRGILGKAVMNWSLDYQSRTLVEGSDFVDVKLFNNTSNESEPKAHLLNRVGAEASLAYPWSDVQLIFGFRHESFTRDFAGEEQPHIERGLTDALSLTVNYDDRNNPVFATRGGLESLRAEQAGLFALGTEFTKFEATVIRHLPTLEDQTLAIRLVGGLGLDLLDDPQEQFTLGGSMTVRGITAERTPSMAFLNLEYRIQIVPATLSVALFADVGAGVSGELKKSVGIEGRFNLPYLGLVRFAFAWPITDRIEYVKVEYGFGSFF